MCALGGGEGGGVVHVITFVNIIVLFYCIF